MFLTGKCKDSVGPKGISFECAESIYVNITETYNFLVCGIENVLRGAGVRSIPT